MKIFNNVRSTAKNIPSIEVNVDTVYVRYDITDISDEENPNLKNIGTEIHYKKDSFIELISQKNNELEEELANVWFDNIVKETKITDNQQEIADLWFEIIGGVI